MMMAVGHHFTVKTHHHCQATFSRLDSLAENFRRNQHCSDASDIFQVIPVYYFVMAMTKNKAIRSEFSRCECGREGMGDVNSLRILCMYKNLFI